MNNEKLQHPFSFRLLVTLRGGAFDAAFQNNSFEVRNLVLTYATRAAVLLTGMKMKLPAAIQNYLSMVDLEANVDDVYSAAVLSLAVLDATASNGQVRTCAHSEISVQMFNEYIARDRVIEAVSALDSTYLLLEPLSFVKLTQGLRPFDEGYLRVISVTPTEDGEKLAVVYCSATDDQTKIHIYRSSQGHFSIMDEPGSPGHLHIFTDAEQGTMVWIEDLCNAYNSNAESTTAVV